MSGVPTVAGPVQLQLQLKSRVFKFEKTRELILEDLIRGVFPFAGFLQFEGFSFQGFSIRRVSQNRVLQSRYTLGQIVFIF